MPTKNTSIFTLIAFIITSISVYFTNGIEKTVYIPFEEDSTMLSELVNLAVVCELLEMQKRTGQIENADILDIHLSGIFKHLSFRYSPIVNIENLDLKNPRFSNIRLFNIH